MLKSVRKVTILFLSFFFILQPETTDDEDDVGVFVKVDNGVNLLDEFDGDNVEEFSSIIVGNDE
jgi:hypothetical protein